ncbi:MAG: DUF3034 family protein [Parvularculaceae bacterium]
MDRRRNASAALTLGALALTAAAAAPKAAAADFPLGDQGRLLATGGVAQVEGAAGAGLAPWALIAGYGSRDSFGAAVHYTHVPLSDFTLRTAGLAVGAFDRVEVSYARLWFDTNEAGAALGLGEDFTFEQDVIGIKARLFGDAVYDQDKWLPQVAVGVQYKSTSDAPVLAAVGAQRDDDVDFYVAATKLFLGRSLLANATVRLTRANQLGLLGFGGDRNDAYRPQLEASLAYLFSRKFAAGVEIRTKPDNLGFAEEDDAFDVFAAYFPTKHVSLTLAYVDLGDIALQGPQRGAYASIQVGF